MQLLEVLISNPPVQEHGRWFLAIAKKLLSSYVIKTHLASYRIKEIEFYYHSKDHVDTTTYGYMKEPPKLERILRHKKAQTNTFTWFFHYSGVDIVFGSYESPGGILIRTIECIERNGKALKEELKGPLVVMLELLNQGLKIDGSNTIQMQLVPSCEIFDITSIKPTKRVGLDKADPKSSEYNFSIS